MGKEEPVTINILGSEWKILYGNKNDYPLLEGVSGYTDNSARKIIIGEKPDYFEPENFESVQRRIIRHEIIHAYFYESGMDGDLENIEFGVPELYVDWFAIQSPKIFKTFDELGVNF